MTYKKTDELRRKVIATIVEAKKESRRLAPPAYKVICAKLDQAEITTGYGRRFDPTTLYAFLYRSGYSGIWGVIQELKGAN